MLEFFRVEALLRSEEVQNLYREGVNGKTLFDRYKIYWDALEGKHHEYLSPVRLEDAGLVDMDSWGQRPSGSALELATPIKHDTSRYLHLQIDCAHPPSRIITALKYLLKIKHSQVKVDPILVQASPWIPRPNQKPPILHVDAWLRYFEAYDMRKLGLSYGAIGKRIFNPPKGPSSKAAQRRQSAYDQAERACDKAERLIAAAVKSPWPPAKL
jgi:hypothetical protein